MSGWEKPLNLRDPGDRIILRVISILEPIRGSVWSKRCSVEKITSKLFFPPQMIFAVDDASLVAAAATVVQYHTQLVREETCAMECLGRELGGNRRWSTNRSQLKVWKGHFDATKLLLFQRINLVLQQQQPQQTGTRHKTWANTENTSRGNGKSSNKIIFQNSFFVFGVLLL